MAIQPLPARFVYMDDNEQIQLIYDQLRNVFDAWLFFNHYTIDIMKHGLTPVSITFNIMTHYEETLKVVYKAEKNTITIHKMTNNILKHLLKHKEMNEMKTSFIDVVDRYALKNLFIIDPNVSYQTAVDLVNALLSRQHGILINLNTNRIEYTVIFHFNDRTVKLTINLNNDENKITLDYHKKIKKTVKGYTTESSKTVSLTKTYFEAFEHCFYDLYLKPEYNIPRRTKDALKVIEMLVI